MPLSVMQLTFSSGRTIPLAHRYKNRKGENWASVWRRNTTRDVMSYIIWSEEDHTIPTRLIQYSYTSKIFTAVLLQTPGERSNMRYSFMVNRTDDKMLVEFTIL